MTLLQRFHRDETGATAIEYGLLVGLIALVALGGLNALSTVNAGKHASVAAAVANAM